MWGRAEQNSNRFMLLKRVSLLVMICALSAACSPKPETRDTRLGGTVIAAQILNEGRSIYLENCARCHGMDGAGQTIAKRGTYPPPDLREGDYKFHSVPDGGLPIDEDLATTLRKGLGQKRMPAFESLTKSEVNAVIQYVKTFSLRWSEESAGVPIKPPPDPWPTSQTKQAVLRGEYVYHVTARCWTCHPGYSDTSALAKKPDGNTAPQATPIRADISRSVPMVTQRGTILPPDLRNPDLPLGCDLNRQVMSIATGIAVSGMPGWQEVLPPDDIWALGHYLQTLCRSQGK